MRIDLGEDEAPEIGLIALIDCIFFLLMFFMVATTFKMQEGKKDDKVQPIELPRAAASLNPSLAAPAPFVIAVDQAGQAFINDDAVSMQNLRGQLRNLAQAEPGRTVRIDGDRRAPFQAIVHVLDLCQFEGLRNVAVRTRG